MNTMNRHATAGPAPEPNSTTAVRTVRGLTPSETHESSGAAVLLGFIGYLAAMPVALIGGLAMMALGF